LSIKAVISGEDLFLETHLSLQDFVRPSFSRLLLSPRHAYLAPEKYIDTAINLSKTWARGRKEK